MFSQWRSLRLGNHALKIGSGATPRGGESVYQSEGISLIRSQNVYNNYFDFGGLTFLDPIEAEKLNNVTVKSGDILLNITGDSVARVCTVPDKTLPARVNQHVAIIRPDPRVWEANFVRYYLVSTYMQEYMLSLADAGATRKALTKGMIENFIIPAPSLFEQHAIADILGSLDDKIELNRRMNATLEETARALFKSWFVDFDPVRAKMEGRQPEGIDAETAALFPDRLVESELGLIPEGWDVVRLSKVCEYIMSGGTPSTKNSAYWEGGIPWLSSGETRSRFIIDTEKTITELGVRQSSTRSVRKFSTVIASAGQGYTRGQASLLMFESYINQSVVAVAANRHTMSDLYVFFDLRTRSKITSRSSRVNGVVPEGTSRM